MMLSLITCIGAIVWLIRLHEIEGDVAQVVRIYGIAILALSIKVMRIIMEAYSKCY